MRHLFGVGDSSKECEQILINGVVIYLAAKQSFERKEMSKETLGIIVKRIKSNEKILRQCREWQRSR